MPDAKHYANRTARLLGLNYRVTRISSGGRGDYLEPLDQARKIEDAAYATLHVPRRGEMRRGPAAPPARSIGGPRFILGYPLPWTVPMQRGSGMGHRDVSFIDYTHCSPEGHSPACGSRGNLDEYWRCIYWAVMSSDKETRLGYFIYAVVKKLFGEPKELRASKKSGEALKARVKELERKVINLKIEKSNLRRKVRELTPRRRKVARRGPAPGRFEGLVE